MQRTLIMGILNVTPDSFSDGGQHDGREDAELHASVMVRDGADIIDIGGESTRPGADKVTEAEELERTIPVVRAIAGTGRRPVSIDTYKASVARAACEAGAVIVNDVTAMSDPEIVDAAVECGAAYVLTYNRGEADASVDAGAEMVSFLKQAIAICEDRGLPREHIILDPGVGFAKSFEQNFQVLRAIDALKSFEMPMLIGVSRKSFIGKLYGAEVGDRLTGSLAAALDSVRRGAHMLRVHDVAAHKQAVQMWETISNAAD
ncbi:MAG: dihydropteroate synthase [Pseudomonadota bacterium]|nr:dihydropteroate synthase [Pseudomonadota bacterium]